MRLAERHEVEDLLRALFECEHHGHAASDARLAGLTGASRASVLKTLARASAAGLAENAEDGWQLTPAGRDIAVLIMRAHRLIETQLARESSVPPSRWHEVAHAHEHGLTRDEVNRLADRLDNPRFDPHGDPIPTREGRIPEPEGQPLLSWRLEETGVIAHLEDEPPSLFAHLVATGLFAGMRFRVAERRPDASVLLVEGRSITLPAELAAMVRVRPLLESETPPPAAAIRLSDLPRGAAADVVTLLPGCIGGERSRLLDLGFVPGSRLEHALQSPFNGPAAFRVRGTLIALRREQAEQVLVVPAAAGA
ncbi:MAG: FeoA domain-containing protein [Opitutaceae bacterium]|nr:FeoA domain-containing protein [Opitutaceae bacterium]